MRYGSDSVAAGASTGTARNRETVFATFAALVLVATPPLHVLLTWQPVYHSNNFRFFSVPVVAGEFLLVVIAALSGLGALRPSRLASLAAAGILGIAAYTTYAVAMDQPRAHILLLILLNHLLFAFVLWSKLAGDWHQIRRIMLFSAAVGVGLMALVSYGLALTVIDDQGFNWRLFGAGVSHVRHLGYYGVLLTGLAAGLYATAAAKRGRIAAFLLLTVGFAWTGLSGGRAAFLAGILGAVLVWLLSPRGSRRTLASVLGTAFTLGIGIALIAAPPSDWWGLPSILGRFFGARDMSEFTTGRWPLWQQTLDAIADHPLIGHGEGQFRHSIALAIRASLNHPHNAVLQFLFQWGVAGTACLAMLVSLALRGTMGALRAEPGTVLPAAGALGGVFALAMLDGPLNYPLPVMIAVLCLVSIRSATPRSA